MIYVATPQYTNPCPEGHEIYNLGGPFLGHHYYTLRLYEPCPEVEKNIFKKSINFTLFTPKSPPLCVGAMSFTISCLLTLQIATNQIWSRLAQ